MDASRSPGFSGSKQRLTIIKNSQASAVFLAMVDDSAYLPGFVTVAQRPMSASTPRLDTMQMGYRPGQTS